MTIQWVAEGNPRSNTFPVVSDQVLGNIPPVTERFPEANAAFTRATWDISAIQLAKRVMVRTFS
jgi:hypothetical protein